MRHGDWRLGGASSLHRQRCAANGDVTSPAAELCLDDVGDAEGDAAGRAAGASRARSATRPLLIEKLRAPDRQAAARAVRPVVGAPRVARPARAAAVRARRKTRLRRKRRRQRRRPPTRGRAGLRRGASRRAGRCPSICRVSAWFIPLRRPARAAAASLHKLGEDVTEMLELVPRQWKVIQHVREKFSCRSCEKITQPPAPSHPIAARPRRSGAAGACAVRQVRPASAADPPETPPMPARACELDVSTAGRLGRRLGGDPDAAGRGDPRPCVRRRAHPRRRHHGAGARRRQDPHRAIMDLRARRSAVRRRRPAGSGLLLLARPRRRASRGASGLAGPG